MENEKRLKSMLGLAYKGGNLTAGSELCKKAVYEGRAKLVILSIDCSDNTKKKFMDKCSHRGIQVVFYGNRELLGESVGKTERTVLAVLDEGFSKEIIKLMGV
jgi:ribosomal protein L7Ae-like RNA K-turn-binding protein